MPTVTYTVLDGEIVEENRGGVISDYVADPLGSTVALLDGSHSKSDTFNYWPYGEVQSRSGSTATPFQFVGTLGYYRDSSSRTYVRARYYRQNLGRWQTVDPLWPWQPEFKYCSGRPTTTTDVYGFVDLEPYPDQLPGFRMPQPGFEGEFLPCVNWRAIITRIENFPPIRFILRWWGYAGIVGLIIGLIQCIISILSARNFIEGCIGCCEGFLPWMLAGLCGPICDLLRRLWTEYFGEVCPIREPCKIKPGPIDDSLPRRFPGLPWNRPEVYPT